MGKKKFLIIRFSSIGDIVLTTPVIRSIKKQFQNSEVHYLSKKIFSDVLIHNPYIDRLHLIHSKISEIIDQLKDEKFDFVIDLHQNLRSKKVKWILSAKSLSFNKLNLEKWLMVNTKINCLPKVHIVDRYFDAIRPLGIVNDDNGLDYFISSEDEKINQRLPNNFLSGYDALVLGGSYNTKKIPLNKLKEICNRNTWPLVLLGGKEEMNTGEILSKHFTNKVYNACGKFSLNQSAALIKSAKKVFTSDTGLMHIASSYKKPIISLWGNTIPEFGMSPYLPGNKSETLEVKGLNCRPCSKLGFNKCPKKHFRCMNDIEFKTEHFV